MSDDFWETDRLWTELERFFPRDLVHRYRAVAQMPFDEARKRLTLDIADAARRRDEEFVHESLVLAHIVLAVISAMRRGVDSWQPLPPVEEKPWKDKEGPLLMWAAQYGSSAAGASAMGLSAR